MIDFDMQGGGGAADLGGRVFGAAIGLVTNNQDPDGLARVKVKLPWLSEDNESYWARIVAPMAGDARGLYMLPEVGDEVLVMFDQGRVDHPYVIGALWNGKDKPPSANADGENNLRIIKSRSGHTITLDDKRGAEKVIIADKTGKNTIVLDAASNAVTITSDGAMTLAAKGTLSLRSSEGDVTIACKRFSVNADTGYDVGGSQGKITAETGLAVTCFAGVDINNGALEVR